MTVPLNAIRKPNPTSEDPSGTIVRIRLKDFLTYSYVEFKPGPNFNFVLGPNGSGKSSLVSAICLGLGGEPKTLMRSTRIEGFIRHGCSRAYVEIELKAEPENLVIQRTIEGQRSDWTVNGQKKSVHYVKERMAEMHIDMENLCNFLPQERVHSFAQLTSQQLLTETMSTVGGKVMLDQFERLQAQRHQETSRQQSQKVYDQEIQSLQKKNDAVEMDVKRYRERNAILKRIEILERKKPWVEYNHQRDIAMTLREQKKQAARTMKQMEDEYAPLLEQVGQLKEVQEKNKANIQQTSAQTDKLRDQVKEKVRELDSMDQEMTDKRNAFCELKKTLKKKKENVWRMTKELEEMDSQLSNPPQDDSRTLTEQITELNKSIREETTQMEKLNNEMGTLKDRMDEVSQQANQIDRKLKDIENIREQRLQMLEKWQPDTFIALQWLRKNSSRFRQKIFGPVLAEINIKDPAYVDAIESVLPQHILVAFVAQNREDYELFLEEICDKQKLRVTAFENSADLIDCPEPVMKAICDQTGAHMIPVSLNAVNLEEANKLNFPNYFSNGMRYTSRQSKYGARYTFTRSTKVTAAFRLRQNVDVHEKKRLEDELEKLKHHYTNVRSDVDQLSIEAQSYQDKIDTLRGEKDRLNERKRAFHQRLLAYKNLESKRNLLSQKLELIRAQMDDDQLTNDYKNEFARICEKRAKLVLEYANKIDRLAVMLEKIPGAYMSFWKSQALFNRHQDEAHQVTERLTVARENLIQVEEEFKVAKRRAHELLSAAQAAGEPDEELKAQFENIPDSLEEIEELLAQEKAQADLAQDFDPAVVSAYERRKREMDEKRAALALILEELEVIQDEMEEIKQVWEPTIDSLISGINSRFQLNFERLGCAGEVRLAKTLDYSEWGIEILVKFRDNEPLAQLTAHRQSGGERSVTTMMYLMALQHFSKAPFRVVDEMNQGMDPRNERWVHSQIVRTVCEPDDPQSGHNQYFLITPKLLPDLDYHERMRVLIVYNGEHVPEPEAWPTCNSIDYVQSIAQES